ncbi:ankyrin repeat domain-containing protein [Kangiella geojedonensis]|uniref:Uncharacterized protein n=1 Tax=Kangiella geojedonensis TaxID=914150 RepID=A0A0F6RCY7_9GAMM|nr:ankyrin repeat domain-containing protein [Kangiella geojedonensis]AKE52461.1 hypothetical protein TQ33_1514 [Kangiella geojedonensis]
MKGRITILLMAAVTCITSIKVIASNDIEHVFFGAPEKKDWKLGEVDNYTFQQLNGYLAFAIIQNLEHEFEVVLNEISKRQYNQFYIVSNIMLSGEMGKDKYAIKLIETLKDVDANIAANGKDTLLHYFSQHGSIEIVKKLLESGANADIRDSFNNKPLDKAAMNDDIAMYRLIFPYTDLTTSIKTPHGDWYYYDSLSGQLLFGDKMNRKDMFSLLINDDDFPKDYFTLANLRMKLYKKDYKDILPIIDPYIKALGYTPVP